MIKILVDSSSEILLEEAKNLSIQIVPLSIQINNKNYHDTYDISKDDFYNSLTTTNEFPKTSQPSPDAFLNFFNSAKENGDEVICILISSELSGTCQSAHLAKTMCEYDNIHIVDSLGATYMIKLMVMYATKLITDGLSVSEIISKLEDIKSRATVYAALDTLEYLYKGGRLNKASATIGELANLKPIISVIDGKVSVVKKCIGKVKAMNAIINHLNTIEPDPDFPIYSIYTFDPTNCEKLESKFSSMDITFQSKQQVGPSIGAHVGPGAFGVVYIRKK